MIRESSRSKKRADAEALLKTRLAAVARGDASEVRVASITVDNLLDDLLRDYELNGKSIAWARIVVKHLRPFFGRWRAIKIGSEQINQYTDKRKREDISNATINRELSLLRRAYYIGLRASPPKVVRVPRVPKLKESDARKGFCDWPLFRKIAEHLSPDVADIALFAFQTGCRRSEILKIRWRQVDFDTRSIRLEAGETKNKAARILPMTKVVEEMMKRRREERDAKWPQAQFVFTRDGRPIKSFRTGWESACQAAGVPEILFHDLRRSGVRNLIHAGVPEKVAMSISGHKTRSIFDRYTIVDERDLKRAAKDLDRFNEKAGEKS